METKLLNRETLLRSQINFSTIQPLTLATHQNTRHDRDAPLPGALRNFPATPTARSRVTSMTSSRRHFRLTCARNGRPSVGAARACARRRRCEMTPAGATNVIDSSAGCRPARQVAPRTATYSIQSTNISRRGVDRHNCASNKTRTDAITASAELQCMNQVLLKILHQWPSQDFILGV